MHKSAFIGLRSWNYVIELVNAICIMQSHSDIETVLGLLALFHITSGPTVSKYLLYIVIDLWLSPFRGPSDTNIFDSI